MTRNASTITITITRLARTLGLGAALMAAACAPAGEIHATPAFMDTDGDSITDGIDVDNDDIIDYSFGTTLPGSTSMTGSIDAALDSDSGQCASIFDMLLDYDGDGVFDALDFDCDGVADIELTPAGGGSGGSGGGSSMASCSSSTSVNGESRAVQCEGTDGSNTCSCLVNSVVVDACTTSGALVCSINGGCCTF